MKINDFQRIFKQYFTLTRGEKIGIYTLCIVLFLLIVANYLIDFIEFKQESDFSEIKEAIAAWEKKQNRVSFEKNLHLFKFDPNIISPEQFDSLNLTSSIKRNILKYRENGGRFYQTSDLRKIYGMNDSIFSAIEPFIIIDRICKKEVDQSKKNIKMYYFDPNSASLNELQALGFNKYQSNNIISYRTNGGVFRSKEDLLKIYGVNEYIYNRVEDWIQISKLYCSVNLDSEKYEIKIIELNSADSLKLISLKGIGSVFTSRIIKFRNLLGGFYEKKQLLEVYNFSEETYNGIEDQIIVDTTLIKKINLNFAEYSDFIRHPYITKETTQAILAYRDNNGSFESCSDLTDEGIINQALYQKLKHYLIVD